MNMEITINRNSAVPVSEEVRRANSKAKDRMHRWRAQYADLSMAIRFYKMDTRQIDGFVSRHNRAGLQAMRNRAREMMATRGAIKHELRRTAYAYAPRETLQDANG
jgi:hypothetical protein